MSLDTGHDVSTRDMGRSLSKRDLSLGFALCWSVCLLFDVALHHIVLEGSRGSVRLYDQRYDRGVEVRRRLHVVANACSSPTRPDWPRP